MTMNVDTDWADVWSEYRSVFNRLRLIETAAYALVGDRGVDPDRLADCVKEFVVRTDRRGMTAEDLRARLRGSLLRATDTTAAVRLFGCSAERVGRVLPDLGRSLVLVD